LHGFSGTVNCLCFATRHKHQADVVQSHDYIWLFWQTLRCILYQGCCKWQCSMLCMVTSASRLAVIAEEAEGHLANNRLAALSGHGELSQEDSSEWELVSSDVDED